MNKVSIILLSCLFLAFTSPEDLRTQNRTNLIKLVPGMTKSQVITTMGTDKAEDFDEEGTYIINNPYTSETLKGKRQTFEILYYHTELSVRNRTIELDELIPLVLSDGKLMGWGWTYLREIAKKHEITYSFIDTDQT